MVPNLVGIVKHNSGGLYSLNPKIKGILYFKIPSTKWEYIRKTNINLIYQINYNILN